MKSILFNDEMVRAILDGRKTQTRRALTPQPTPIDGGWRWKDCMMFNIDLSDSCLLSNMCPFGKPGDRLWVREAFGVVESRFAPRGCTIRYRADDATGEVVGESGLKYAGKDMSFRWRPSIHMPRWASRITLEITDIRCQRLQDISEEDCWSEGIEEVRYAGDEHGSLRGSVLEDYRALWDSIANPGAKWRDDPWVWAISFKRVEV